MTKLAELQSDINYIKDHIEDVTLSDEDGEAIAVYEKEKKEGKLISHEEVKKELEL